MSRIKSGLEGLDRLIEGGFPHNSRILLSGGPGTGKTLVGLRFLLEGAVNGEKCCYVSLNEEKDEIVRASQSIKSLAPLEKYIDRNVAVEHIPMDEGLNLKKFMTIMSKYPSLDRLVVDNVNKLFMYAESDRQYRTEFSRMLKMLKAMKCSLLICETREDRIDTDNGESFECDGVVHLSFLDLEEKPMRTLQIQKLRYTSFDPRVPTELVINGSDIRLTKTKAI